MVLVILYLKCLTVDKFLNISIESNHLSTDRHSLTLVWVIILHLDLLYFKVAIALRRKLYLMAGYQLTVGYTTANDSPDKTTAR